MLTLRRSYGDGVIYVKVTKRGKPHKNLQLELFHEQFLDYNFVEMENSNNSSNPSY